MSSQQKYIDSIRATWGDRLRLEPAAASNELMFSLEPPFLSHLNDICSVLAKTFHAHFVTLVGNDERPLNGALALYYVFSIPADDLFLTVRVPVDPRHMEVPSVSTTIEAASWFEREVKDWFGIIAFPNIASLASHPDWPEDVHPMLKDFAAAQTVPRVRGTLHFKPVEGEGIFEIPVGPVHAGIIEPGHFRFSVAGEPIINLELQLFYTHKGTEKIAEGMPVQQGVFLAERISGDSSFAHAIAYCHSVERLCRVELPHRALVVRTLLLELERLTNHIGDIGAILLDVGFAVGAAKAAYLKEQLLQLSEILTGSRLLRGMAVVGGVRRDVEDTHAKRQALRETIRRIDEPFEELIRLVRSSSSVLDRLETTGQLSRKDAYRLGVVGIAGRASGLVRDLRTDHPHGAYPHLAFQPVVYEAGDVLARMNVRIDEVRASFEIIRRLLGQHAGEPIAVPVDAIVPGSAALGYVEGWRGEIVHWLMTDARGRIYRWKITDPSFHNWRALPLAVRNNIVPDFPVINKSFNLSYSGSDR